MQELTTKQTDERPIDKTEIFCLHYLQTFDTLDSWKKANPTSEAKNKGVLASRFLAKPETQQRLRTIAATLIPDLEQDVRDIIEETKRIAAFNPMDIITIDDNGEPKLDLSKAQDNPDIMRLLNIEFGRVIDKDGGRHSVYKLKPYDKMDAIEKLYKLHKLYSATGSEELTRNIQVNVNFPLPGEHWRTGEPVPEHIVEYLDN